jgi:hypothetical protein
MPLLCPRSIPDPPSNGYHTASCRAFRARTIEEYCQEGRKSARTFVEAPFRIKKEWFAKAFRDAYIMGKMAGKNKS